MATETAGSVTDATSLGPQQGESRNAEDAIGELSGWLRRFTPAEPDRACFWGVTDAAASGPQQGESRNRFHEARRTGALCGVCGAPLPDGPEGPRLLAGFGWRGYRQQWDAVPVCADCADPVALGRAEADPTRWARRCGGCGRTLYYLATAPELRHSRHRHTWCSYRCRDAYYTRRSARHLGAQEARQHKTCAVCGEVFDGTRRDAVTCSPACRQKAYRQRRRQEAAG